MGDKEGPRSGGAMIQSVHGAKAPPLKGRLVTVEAEIALLEGRVAALMGEVGITADGTAAAAPAALVESSLFGSYAALLRSKGENLDATVTECETKMHKVNADILTLENKVSGNAFSKASSLLESTVKEHEYGVSLDSRTVSL